MGDPSVEPNNQTTYGPQREKISIGLEGSGSKVLAKQIILLNSVDKNNSQIYNLSNEEAIEKLLAGLQLLHRSHSV